MTIYNKFLINTLKILFYLFPLSFLFGNLIINLFVFLIIILGILYYKNDLLKWNDNFLFICLTFFSYFCYLQLTIITIFLKQAKML